MRRETFCFAPIIAATLAAAFVLGAAAPVRADQEAPMTAEARAHLERGLGEFQERRYDAAIAEFRAGYALEPRRELLFAWAQSERLSGDCPSAIALYKKFLAASPSEAQAEAAKENLAKCEEALSSVAFADETAADPTAAPGASDPAAPAPAVAVTAPTSVDSGPPRWYHDRVGNVLAGTGAGAVVVGTIFYMAGRSSASSARDSSQYDAYAEDMSQATSRKRISAVSFVAAAGLLGGAAVRYWWVTRPEALPREQPGVTFEVGAAGAMLQLGGAF